MLNTSAFRSTDGGKTLTQHRRRHARRPPRPLDRSGRPAAPRARQRRRRRGDVQRGARQRTGRRRTSPTGAVLPRHHRRRTSPTTCAARSRTTRRCACRATPARAAAAWTAGGGFGRIPPVAPYQVGGGEPGYIAPDPTDPDVFYRRREQRRVHHAAQPPHGRAEGSRRVPALLLGRAVERGQGTLAVDVPDHLLAGRSERCSTPRRSTCGRRPTAARRGTRSAATSRATIRRRCSESGGPITHDMNSPEIYATVFSLGPGKTDINVIWAGSDDGLVHVTRDGGKTWANVTPKDMPDLGRVSQIDASTFDAGTAYVAVKKPLLDDYAPYIFRTHDFGKTWTKIVTGIAANDYVARVREDPTRKGLLYAGTQHGVYISLRRRRSLAVAAAEPARHAGVRHLGRRQRHRDRHARPRLLRSSTTSPRCGSTARRPPPPPTRTCSSRATRSAAAARRRSPTG